MSLLSRVGALLRGNPLDNPAVPLSAPAAWLYDLFGGGTTDAGVIVNEQTAMQLATVYTCVKALSSDISTLPVKVFQQVKGGKELAVDSSLYDLLAVEPNPEMTGPTFFGTWVACAVLTGNGYAEIQRNTAGQPIALWPRHPRFVKAMRTALQAAGTALGGELVYEISDSGGHRTVKAMDMLHLPGLTMDGWVGLSPIQAARQTIGTAIAAEKFGAGFFGRGSRPSGLLTGPAEQRDDVKLTQARDSWEKANSGENQGRTAVLKGDWKWTAIGINPDDAQFLETQQYTRTQLAALFNMPPHRVGDTARQSNGNRESDALDYVNYTLRPWIVRMEAELQRKLMPRIGRSAGRYTVRFDVTELEKADFTSMMNGFAVGKQWGFKTTNEIKAKLGENPIGPEGDIYYVPLNMVPVGQEADPNDANPDDGPPAGNGGRNQRMLLDRIAQAYGPLFRDAQGRLLKRSKRDAEAVGQIFGPVLEAIAAEGQRQARGMFKTPEDADLGAEKILRDCRKAIEKRAAEWKAETAAADTEADLARTVRAITLGIFREAGSNVALTA